MRERRERIRNAEFLGSLDEQASLAYLSSWTLLVWQCASVSSTTEPSIEEGAMNHTQFRMAKGALGLTSLQLARSAGVRTATVNRYLIGHDILPNEGKLLRQAFVDAGVTFLSADDAGSGIRLRHSDEKLSLNLLKRGRSES